MNLNVLDLSHAHVNLGAPQLIEYAIQRGEGQLSRTGALVVNTGVFTGRSPKDKFIVRDATTEPHVAWGPVNQPMSDEHFCRIYERMIAHLQGKELFVQDLQGGADPTYQLNIRAVTQTAWHSLFARQLLIRPATPSAPDFTLIFAPDFETIPAEEGSNSSTCIAIHFGRKLVLIAGTSYAGELKKSVFTLLNYLLPERGVMPMHCSANVGTAGDVALFFGLSGTGKTTLSADPKRNLIGDDEHGWSNHGVFNFEGGCYAKCIKLSHEGEPQIWNAIRFGTVLENVVMDETTRDLDFDSAGITENTRAAYPLDFIANALIPSVASSPTSVIFLTADAFGVLPPVSKLTPEQAMYHFLSGYTAKVAGTERGLGSEPQATFSACYGSPFLPRTPATYAAMLGEKLRAQHVTCWLVNTGWVGGAYGTGSRIKLAYTRAILDGVLSGALSQVPAIPHPVFGVMVPQSCPGIPPEVLDARGQWADPHAYDLAAADLSRRFTENYKKFEN